MHLHIKTTLALLLVSILQIAWADAASALQPKRPNVLFILVDDLGWKDLGCYGNDVFETPNLDKLAEQGMRFTDAYAACPICGPSRAAILMGKFPSTSGYVDNYIIQDKDGKLSRTPSGKLKGDQIQESIVHEAERDYPGRSLQDRRLSDRLSWQMAPDGQRQRATSHGPGL